MDDINAGYERLAELQAVNKANQLARGAIHHMNVSIHHEMFQIHFEEIEEQLGYRFSVKNVNGIEIKNLKHLCQLVENCSRESLRIDLDDDRVVALNYESARIATSRILERHRIPSRMSIDLLSEQNSLLMDSAE
ncbi:hypothetical protein GOBAR_DD30765 [Gossypium barbadense]|nr:hypothetical protein GOBAR_DD30765 [Gossypium barbadense]